LLLCMQAHSQKLWDKVLCDEKFNKSELASSVMVNDTMIVFSGFINLLTCWNSTLQSMNTRGHSLWGHTSSPYESTCLYAQYSSFRNLAATSGYLYSWGEIMLDDVITGDEPLVLRKYDFEGNLLFTTCYQGEDWISPVFVSPGMDADEQWGVILAFTNHLINGVVLFDTNGEFIFEKQLDSSVKNLVFTEQGDFAILTENHIHLMSVTGETKHSLAVESHTGQLVYLDYKLYYTGPQNIYSVDIETYASESIFEVPYDVKKLTIVNDSLWVLFGDPNISLLTNVFAENPLKYTLPSPGLDVQNFFITDEEIILTGTSRQGQMALIAYSRAETSPGVTWPDVELVDFEIYNIEYHYVRVPELGYHFESHISFDSRLIIKNNGPQTIQQLGLQSDRIGGFNCGRHYFYKELKGLTIAPSQEVVIDIGNSTDYQYKWDAFSVCYQLMAPNGSIEQITNNNLICKMYDFTNVRELTLQQHWKVFPNPAGSHLNIEAKLPGIYDYLLFSYNGKVVISGTSSNALHRLDISRLPAGLYLLQVKQGGEVAGRQWDEVYTVKVVKE
jgi:hypothetical protein